MDNSQIQVIRIRDKNTYLSMSDIPDNFCDIPGLQFNLDLKWQSIEDGDIYSYAIFYNKDKLCGSVEIADCNSKTPRIEIEILEGWRNKGIGPAAINKACELYQQEKFVDYFIIYIESTNAHSIHVASIPA